MFHSPSEAASSPVKLSDITFEYAQEEIAQNSGFSVDDDEDKGNCGWVVVNLSSKAPKLLTFYKCVDGRPARNF